MPVPERAPPKMHPDRMRNLGNDPASIAPSPRAYEDRPHRSPFSVFSHRVFIALKEADAEHKEAPNLFTISPLYSSSCLTQILCITYGCPDTDPADPSPESHKIHESLVICKFISDIYPNARLVPSDPLQRVAMRLFIAIWE
ncbi:uncharacterized protein BXZ73DRAFT_101866 [Epithele typhae]|uniref:uncharacterized protein n=1 Tax=Epithele typhae TaxID=378194 RepID=UPI0020076165|nr:uncharacterized protein BXZ73DRAFT_101866 [Epithele typhae]KAH9930494.1 hypothetical protein BXZ73DRAFT_101866 [Epithele typhae]